MTPLETIEAALGEIEAREKAATPGPWSSGMDWKETSSLQRARDEEFLIGARTDIPKLIAALRKACHVLDASADMDFFFHKILEKIAAALTGSTTSQLKELPGQLKGEGASEAIRVTSSQVFPGKELTAAEILALHEEAMGEGEE